MTAPVGQTESPQRPQRPQPAAGKRRGTETARDMLLSLAVLLALVFAFVALLPRHRHNPARAVDYSEQVRLLAVRAPFPVEAPVGLPPAIQPNFVRSSLDPAALHIGLVIDGTRFARLDESGAPDAAFLGEAAVGPPTGETVQSGGQRYEVYRDALSVQPGQSGQPPTPGSGEALVRRLPGGALLTISDGGDSGRATRADLLTIAATLRVAPRPS